MAYVSIMTVLDEGTADVIREALEAEGVEVEIHRRGVDVYFGSAAPASFQIRVPEADAERARKILAWMSRTFDTIASPEDGEEGAEEPPATPDDKTVAAPDETSAVPDEAPSRSDRRSWIAIGVGLVVPLPVGALYARRLRLGYGLLGICLGGLAMGLSTGRREGLYLAVLAKALDFGLAPLFIAGPRRGARIFGSALFSVSLLCALAFIQVDRKEQLRRRMSEQSTELFANALQGIGQLDEVPPFPDVPVGRMHRLLCEFLLAKQRGLAEIKRLDPASAWAGLLAKAPASEDLDDFERRLGRWRTLIDKMDEDAGALFDRAGALTDKDETAQAFYEALQHQRDKWEQDRAWFALLTEEGQAWGRGLALLRRLQGRPEFDPQADDAWRDIGPPLEEISRRMEALGGQQ